MGLAEAGYIKQLATDTPTKGVTILGATGSVGVNTLDVVARNPEHFRIIALTANTRADRLLGQCRQFKPVYAVMRDHYGAQWLEARIQEEGLHVKVLCGDQGLSESVSLPETDIVMSSIVGAAGLMPTLSAMTAGKRVLLANKEPLVMSGRIILDTMKQSGAELIPIDSEHNAIFQCMPAGYQPGTYEPGVKRILLTCSGGPFLRSSTEELMHVTPEQACNHPKWRMGRKISVDSATLMNKGLELIEACWLFSTRPEQVQIVIHPQSVVHSMVEYQDGSVLAQLGNPDMRTPISHAMGWPDRIESGVGSLDLFDIARLDFEPPDFDRFPCLKLATAAAHSGGTAPAILNASNEAAVQAFLDQRIGFLDIYRAIEYTMDRVTANSDRELEQVLDDDTRAREIANQFIRRRS
ncbi:MAG: 1-deoxy-D-xylulose-5-phosphate reductoisomerase [Pseudomonadota bacterium]